MINSMTGFGRGEATGVGMTVTVEMRSVNNRFLEVSPKMPREFSRYEHEIRELLKKAFTRGKISVSVNVTREKSDLSGIELDVARVEKYKEILNEIRKVAKIKEVATLSHLLVFKDELVRQVEGDQEGKKEWEVVAEAAQEAIKNLSEMRTQEGQELSKDLSKRLDAIDNKVNRIETASKEQVPEERKRLRERIARLFENDEVDEQRLETEIIYLAEKLDITEECVRWRSHSKFFREAMKDRESAGRKLNFLQQEMLREINTMGSKSIDPRITRMVVEAKEELEKIREQVQNIE